MIKNVFWRLNLALLLVCLLFTLAAENARAQDGARERRERIRTAVDRNDYTSAVNDLRAFFSSDPSAFTLNNYDYLLARLSERRGDVGAAATGYQQVAQRGSVLTEYALWHLAQISRMTGNLMLERQQLNQLLATSAQSLLRDAAEERLAESFFESGDYPSAIQLLRQRATGTAPRARAAQALMGQAHLRSGQQAAAREVFTSLVTKLPDQSRPDDYALAAVRGLDQLDSGSAEAAQQKAPSLDESEHQRRAFIYMFNRDFAAARRHYTAIAERYSQSASVPDALYQTGRAFYLEMLFDDAINYFQRVARTFPESTVARDALANMAAAYNRTKRTDEAVATYNRIMERYTETDVQERAYLNMIDALRDGGRDREALEWVRKTRERFKGQSAALALFSQARIHLAQNLWAETLSDLDALRNEADLGGGRAPGGTNRTEISFMRAFTLEQLGRTDEAVNAYLLIPDGRNEYYGWRATERLRAMTREERTRNNTSARLSFLREEARQAINRSDAERARIAAQSALRLTEDADTTLYLLEIVRLAYGALPSYNGLPRFQLLPFGRQELRTEGAAIPSKPTHKILADELLFLGLYDEGAPELAVAENATEKSSNSETSPARGEESAGRVSDQGRVRGVAAQQDARPAQAASAQAATSRDMRYTLAVLYRRGEMADHAIRFVEPIWKTMPADYLLELAPREMVELFYPAPYRAALMEYAPARGVDPRFVLAIMRQETRFRPEAKSVSAARGLMQFIPATADTIAAQLGKKSFGQDDLYDPRVAILFGSQYMGNLFKQFPQMPQAVAASYNGGEDNVARWLARSRTTDPDRYVSEVAYAQSKDYVYKVLANFRVYQTLYTEQLAPK